VSVVKKVVSEHWQKTFIEAIAKNKLIVFTPENSITKHFPKFIERLCFNEFPYSEI
jgi:hypothetical protein